MRLNWMKLTYLLSCVIQACVTIAPNGLSASFDISLPVNKSQTPTQSLVTVTAKLPSSAKLLYNIQSELHAQFLLLFLSLQDYLNMSICSSCLSMTWTCSKILLIFHTLTLLSMLDVTTLFQFPTVNASNWMILAKCASSIFTKSDVSSDQTYRFFLRKTI